ncbi:MAG: hypothetical protein WD081_01155 [Gammaproteobacteria bacterium]
MKFAVLASCLFLALTGCVPAGKRYVPLDRDGALILNFKANQRAAYILSSGDRIAVCSEPAVDVVFSTRKTIDTTLTLAKESGKLDAASIRDAIELSGRTELVVLAREMLYRICELQLSNENFDTTKLAAMHTQVLDTLKTMAHADLVRAEASLPVPVARSASVLCLSSWLAADPAKEEQRVKKLSTWMVKKEIDAPLSLVVRSGLYEDERLEFIEEIELGCESKEEGE